MTKKQYTTTKYINITVINLDKPYHAVSNLGNPSYALCKILLSC